MSISIYPTPISTTTISGDVNTVDRRLESALEQVIKQLKINNDYNEMTHSVKIEKEN